MCRACGARVSDPRPTRVIGERYIVENWGGGGGLQQRVLWLVHPLGGDQGGCRVKTDLLFLDPLLARNFYTYFASRRLG